MFIYVYAKANTMKGHDFSDDVALCRAWTKSGAIKKFKKLYILTDEECDKCVCKLRRFNKKHYSNVIVLTDY